MLNQIKISVVIPLYNEEKNIEELYKKLFPELESLSVPYEIIFVNDGSTDKSFELIRTLCKKNKHILGISLSRNFGHQIALMAGIEQAKGEMVVMMDADLQHPPELIPQLYKTCQEGFDIVNTKRIDSEEIGVFKKLSSKLFYRLINFLSDYHIEPSSSDFRLLNRKAITAFLKIQERDRFTRGLISWLGFRQSIIEYEAPPRFAGKSKYTVKKMIRLGLNGITSFSAKPLRLSFYTGLFIFFMGLIYAFYAVIDYFRGETIKGWASLIITVLIIGGVQLLSLGIIGEYIARIFNESKARPIYIVQELVKNSEKED